MAERILRQLIDDISGSDIPDGEGERIAFSLRGVDYQIDLSAVNVAKLDKALKPYIEAATKVGGGRRRRATKSASASGATSKEQLATIRAWARKKGYEVSDRGRIKADIVEAFEAAQ
ncbi:histone-like nucleoid-structuring protein Lsr2 [Mycobacteroides abscessus]|uniref:histone-like nucleoid-structuring protein Lsr2 n=1 Tax=Mycobacteroides abscessus TaxID=36809 RepID=UPI000C259BA5|nr:Lsr2 family protein [Mycobacteroides abscessus]AWG62949.1 Lsr2 family protein [Mycobacteroides abscessus]PVA29550.1 Lsr2 family protein [Mycobacteroides abscessus]PVA43456.1 Lsr2 family protein [Mycobacteroides abscessus]PVA73592.1 Lsr2 family protein [Mycobacteroides abscessus]PVB12069.1 Lsr2 family protein [Mycobacteroides abscessus]